MGLNQRTPKPTLVRRSRRSTPPLPSASPKVLPASKKATSEMPAALTMGDSISSWLIRVWVPPITRRSSAACGSSVPMKELRDWL